MMMSFWADFLSCKNTLKSQVMIALIVGVVIGLGSGNPAIVPPMITFIVTVSTGFTLVALDERNDWEGFRCTLPVSRRDVIAGRTAFIALVAFAFTFVGVAVACIAELLAPFLGGVFGSQGMTLDPLDMLVATCMSLAILFVMMAIYMPVVAKLGMTKAVRCMPLVFVMLFILVLLMGGFGESNGVMASLDAMISNANAVLISAGSLLAGLVVFAAGGHLAANLYEAREF